MGQITLSAQMLFMQLATGLVFHTHSLVLDSLFRLSEIQSSFAVLYYFTVHEQKFNQTFVLKTAKIHLAVSFYQFIALSAIVGYGVHCLMKEGDLKVIP